MKIYFLQFKANNLLHFIRCFFFVVCLSNYGVEKLLTLDKKKLISF